MLDGRISQLMKDSNVSLLKTSELNISTTLDKRELKGILYDFYGELLTDHQRKIYEDVVFNDFSLSEIADEEGISRQGVHDIVKRCDKILLDYESKLHLAERFSSIKQKIEEIKNLTDSEEIKKLAYEIIEEL